MSEHELDNIRNMAVYNLTKRNILYTDMANQAKETWDYTRKKSYFYAFVPYSYTPMVYVAGALIYHAIKKRVSMFDMFFHCTAIVILNKRGLNDVLKETRADDWADYEKATEDYLQMMKMEKFSLWAYMRKKIHDKYSPSDWATLLHYRPS